MAELSAVTQSEAAEPAARVIEKDDDGFHYDVETGEVLGHSEAGDSFRIETTSQADWALSLRADVEEEIVGVDRRLEALLSTFKARRRGLERKLEWWDRRFRPDLVAFARRVLEGSKRRTAAFEYGSVSFRRTPGTSEILDMEAARKFVDCHRPDLVKVTYTVTSKAIQAAIERARESSGREPFTAAFYRPPEPSEKATIETGVLGG